MMIIVYGIFAPDFSNSTPILHYYIIAKILRNAKAKYIDKLPYMRVLSITIAEKMRQDIF